MTLCIESCVHVCSVALVSAAFDGKKRIERHKMVYGTLEYELANGLHALSLKLNSPEEVA